MYISSLTLYYSKTELWRSHPLWLCLQFNLPLWNWIMVICRPCNRCPIPRAPRTPSFLQLIRGSQWAIHLVTRRLNNVYNVYTTLFFTFVTTRSLRDELSSDRLFLILERNRKQIKLSFSDKFASYDLLISMLKLYYTINSYTG